MDLLISQYPFLLEPTRLIISDSRNSLMMRLIFLVLIPVCSLIFLLLYQVLFPIITKPYYYRFDYRHLYRHYYRQWRHSHHQLVEKMEPKPNCSTSPKSLKTRINSLFLGILLQLKKSSILCLEIKPPYDVKLNPITENFKYRRDFPRKIIMHNGINQCFP